ncbi:putative ribonuclease H-like domain-containing protein, partial [Tanacetum coccineum]
TAGNQTNKNAGPQEANGNTGLKQSVDAGQSEEKNVSTQQYIMFPLWSSISSSYKSSDENDTADDSAGESPRRRLQSNQMLLEKSLKHSATGSFFKGRLLKPLVLTVLILLAHQCAPRTSNDSGPSFVSLGRSFPLNVNDLSDDHRMPDLEDTAKVQNTGILGSAFDDEDLDTYNSPFADQVMGAEADFNNMEPSTIVSPIPTTRVHSIHPKDQIIGDPKSAVKAMQEELLQFKIQKMDVKSAFLYGTIEEEVYVSQPLGFVDPEFPDKVYKVEKALYGLHEAPRSWYETLSTYLLDNGFYRGQIDNTLFIKRVKDDILLVQYM